MRWMRRISLALTVWLTATMSLVAGMPYFVCVCAAPLQPSARPAPIAARTCCCGDGSCLADDPAQEPPACCQHADRPVASSQHAGPRIQQTGCTFGLIQPEDLICIEARVAAPPVLSDAVPVGLSSPFGCSGLVRVGQRFGQAHGRAPPTDLVTMLQRLLL